MWPILRSHPSNFPRFRKLEQSTGLWTKIRAQDLRIRSLTRSSVVSELYARGHFVSYCVYVPVGHPARAQRPEATRHHGNKLKTS
jgi:hypothetical protein